MSLMRTCSVCGKTKQLRGGFHYNRDTHVYSKVCIDCEGDNCQRIRLATQKNNIKGSLLVYWEKLCPLMTEAELDQVIFNLRQKYNDSKR